MSTSTADLPQEILITLQNGQPANLLYSVDDAIVYTTLNSKSTLHITYHPSQCETSLPSKRIYKLHYNFFSILSWFALRFIVLPVHY